MSGWTERHLANLANGSKPSKYNARKKVVDGITFDSTREAMRYKELNLAMICGEISRLKLQPEFVLQEHVRLTTGKMQRAIVYRADFEYQDGCGNRVVEDVKGFKTAAYKLKAKMFRCKYPNIIFRETA